jgi:hypothetical protein
LLPELYSCKEQSALFVGYDEIGLIWLLDGQEVVALTDATAAIKNAIGNVTIYRRHNKPALGAVVQSINSSAVFGERFRFPSTTTANAPHK